MAICEFLFGIFSNIIKIDNTSKMGYKNEKGNLGNLNKVCHELEGIDLNLDLKSKNSSLQA